MFDYLRHLQELDGQYWRMQDANLAGNGLEIRLLTVNVKSIL